MFSVNESPEDIIAKQERELMLLGSEIATLKECVAKIYEEIGITPEELDAALQKSENFTPEEWSKMQAVKKEIEERIEMERAQIVDPKKASLARIQQSELARNWIFVR